MKAYKKQGAFVALIVAVLLLVSSCGVGTSTLSGGQLLQNSLKAMNQLKSFHFDMNLADSVNSGQATSSTSTGAQSITVNITGNGDEVTPDKTQLHVSLNLAGITGSTKTQNYSTSEIVLGNKLYVQNANGQWYVSNENVSNPFAAANVSNYTALLNLAQKATLTDHGDQNLNGVSLHHLTLTFGKNSLKDLLNASGQLGSLGKNIDTLLNNVNLQTATLDLWIDDATSYIHHMELKLNLSMNLGSLGITPTTSTSSNFSDALDLTVDFSKFNESITINAPANAIPTDNPFSGSFGGA